MRRAVCETQFQYRRRRKIAIFRAPTRSQILRGDLARKVEKQTVTVMELKHSAGLVHGERFVRSAFMALLSSDLKSSKKVHRWLDIYSTSCLPIIPPDSPGHSINSGY